MRITHKPTVDKQAVGRAQARMDQIKRRDFDHAKTLKAQREAVGAKKGEGRVAGYSEEAVMEAVATHGSEVLSDKRFWKEVKIENPWMCADGVVPTFDSPNGRANKYGKVRERWRGGRWEHWDKKRGEWVPGEITKRKGAI